MQRRNENKRNFPLYWQVTAAGHVTKGSTPMETAIRELKEELGINTKLKFYRKFFEKLSDESMFRWIFVGKYNNGDFILQEEEVKEAMFFSIEEFEKRLINDKVESVSADLCREFWGMK